MKNIKMKLFVLSLALIMVLALPGVSSAQAEISGSLKSSLIWDEDADKLLDEETLNLVLERDFGLDADLTVDVQFDSYRTDQVVSVDENGEPTIENLAQSQRKLDIGISEAYVNYYTDNMDWTLGRQVINWGSSFELQPTDYFNPRDLNALDPIEAKVGVSALQGTYYAPGNFEITGVLTPFFDSHKMREVDELEQKMALREGSKMQMSQAIAGQLQEPPFANFNQNITPGAINDDLNVDFGLDEVEDSVENMQGGLQLTRRRWGNFDVSASVYRGRDKVPALDQNLFAEEVEGIMNRYGFYLQESSNPMNFIEWYKSDSGDLEASPERDIRFVYPRATRLGLDLIGDFSEFSGWLEVAYSIYDQDQFDDRLEATLGLDRRFANELYLVGQYYHRSGRLTGENDVNLATLYLEKPVADFHKIQMSSMYEFESDSYLLELQFDYSLTESVVWQTGATYTETESAQAGMLDTMSGDRIYTRIQVDF